MGKYMRKSKKSVAEGLGSSQISNSSSSSLGVRTRARTLALRAAGEEDSGGSYLQLRSRRLEKSLVIGGGRRQRKKGSGVNVNPSSGPNLEGNLSPNLELEKEGCLDTEKVVEKKNGGDDEGGDLGIEQASFAENVLEIEGLLQLVITSYDGASRETTPCSLIPNANNVQTPGSSTRRASSLEANMVARNPMLQQIPTTREMDMLFASAEKEQQEEFMKKYNYDPVKDKPLPGRYEWVKIDP
ncbi:hypothetical protein LguiB_026241 [Lonicera macranthoides]